MVEENISPILVVFLQRHNIAENSSYNLYPFCSRESDWASAENSAWLWSGNRVFLFEFVAVLMIPTATISHNVSGVQLQQDHVAEPQNITTKKNINNRKANDL